MRLHYRQRLQYMNAVADYLIELGYHVEEPDPRHDRLDVWGTVGGRRCFIEIYLHAISKDERGTYGVWGAGEAEDEELFLSNDPTYGLDTRFAPMLILEGLKPFKKGKRK